MSRENRVYIVWSVKPLDCPAQQKDLAFLQMPTFNTSFQKIKEIRK